MSRKKKEPEPSINWIVLCTNTAIFDTINNLKGEKFFYDISNIRELPALALKVKDSCLKGHALYTNNMRAKMKYTVRYAFADAVHRADITGVLESNIRILPYSYDKIITAYKNVCRMTDDFILYLPQSKIRDKTEVCPNVFECKWRYCSSFIVGPAVGMRLVYAIADFTGLDFRRAVHTGLMDTGTKMLAMVDSGVKRVVEEDANVYDMFWQELSKYRGKYASLPDE